jgi:hypothetical protein
MIQPLRSAPVDCLKAFPIGREVTHELVGSGAAAGEARSG